MQYYKLPPLEFTMSYIRRSLESVVQSAAEQFPVVALTGPRQSGKTTLLRHILGDRCAYVSMETPDTRLAAITDPRGFLDFHESPVILDEIQYAPELLMYVKERVDSRRDVPGQYFITGSQNLLLNQNITESLAGRVAMLTLLPLSNREIAGEPDAALPWEEGPTRTLIHANQTDLWRSFMRGGYPELVAQPTRNADLWFASYMQTYLERDVRSLSRIGDLTQFQIFLRVLAAQSGALLNLNSMARDLGTSLNTLKNWLSLLEATYQVFILRPYHANISKRLVKTPKVYFSDVGLMCRLVGLGDAGHAMNGPMSGAIVETAVINEIVRTIRHRGAEPRLYFWRTATGVEVDLLVEAEGRIIPVEVKQSATPRRAMAKGIRGFQADIGDVAAPGFVVHTGDVKMPLGDGTLAWPFAGL